MNTSEIEKLLDKFYNGETSLEEEKNLKNFFLTESVPPHLSIHAEQFLYYSKNAKEKISDPLFEEKFLRKAETVQVIMKPVISRYYFLMGIAAGLLLLMGLLFTFRQDVLNRTTKENPATSPEMAFKQTQNILMLVSLNLNRGVDKMHYLGQFDKAIQKVNYLCLLYTSDAADE